MRKHFGITSSNQQEQTPMVWPCHKERGRVNAEVCNEVEDKGKETDMKTNTNVARHLRWPHEMKKTYLKEVLQTKCFENIQYWRTMISRSTNRSSGEDP